MAVYSSVNAPFQYKTAMTRYVIFLFIVATASKEIIEDGIDKLSMIMLKEAYMTSADSNVVTSPLGVILLLTLYSYGVDDDTQREIVRFLGSNTQQLNPDSLIDSYSNVGLKFSSMDSSNFTLANKIYVAKGLTPTEKFYNILQFYRSEIESIDFEDKGSAADTINRWAAEKTKGHIAKPVTEKTFDNDTVAGLFNIIYFQGHWHVPFKAEETVERDFYVSRNIAIKKPTMHLLRPLFYYVSAELGARLIELPYKETDFRMIVVLPDEVDGLPLVLDKLTTRGLLESVLALTPSTNQINLYMPKFDIRSKLDYKPILRNLGIKKIFYKEAPGVVKEGNVTVSKYFQEANIKVDEEGATAGAFTGVILQPGPRPGLPPVPLDFIVDHPFFFAILHKNVVIFDGTYSS